MIRSLKITAREMETGQIDTEHLALANQALREDGIVVLEDVVATSHLETLRVRMARDLEEILSRPDAPFQFNTGNVQQDPPPFEPYLFRDVLVNDIVISVTKSILGAGLKNVFYSGNTALPSKSRQPVHADTGQLWPDLEVATPAYQLVVNIPLVDMSETNGSTEIWPGTHLDTTVAIQDIDLKVPEEKLARRRAEVPPLQPTVRLGSVVIRDIRLWHAGMPNHTETPRPMLAMIHSVSWWPGERLTFAKGAEPFLIHTDLRTEARFADGPIDYLHRHTAHDLQK
jgi:ectoine hydroxylase-related dioxygenase (phytanoyl-CoA dioxygenase family)